MGTSPPSLFLGGDIELLARPSVSIDDFGLLTVEPTVAVSSSRCRSG